MNLLTVETTNEAKILQNLNFLLFVLLWLDKVVDDESADDVYNENDREKKRKIPEQNFKDVEFSSLRLIIQFILIT